MLINSALVSILTVTHDPRFHFVVEAARSVMNQSYTHWEWLILHETENPGQSALDEYMGRMKDERIKCLSVAYDITKCPFTVRRNELLDRARGKYFTILNDDDLMLPDKLEKMVRIGEQSDADLICCSVGIVNKAGNLTSYNAVQKAEPRYLSVENIKRQNPLDIGGFIFRKETYENTYGFFNEKISTAEDWDILYRSAVMGAKITTIPDVLHLYRQHALQTIHRVKNEPDFGRMHEEDLSSIRSFERPEIFVYVPSNPLTTSQKFVCERIMEEGWREPLSIFKNHHTAEKKDLLLCLAPFLYSPLDLLAIKSFPGTRLAIQMEDPWALKTNMGNALHFDFIYTNDVSGINHYDNNTKIGILPTNSVSKRHLDNSIESEKEYDVALVGYAYPSRKKEIESLMPLFQKCGVKILLVGEGWSRYAEKPIVVLHSVISENLVALLNKARYVLCLEREINDVPGCFAGLSPHIPSRGYIEYASSARPIFKRYQRDIGNFGSPLVYGSIMELEAILNNETENIKPDWTAWTYRNRIGQVIANWLGGRSSRIIL
jgi:hypothetical protein